MKVIIVSNGHGEDCIAGNIATALLKELPSATIEAYPLVGNGHTFSKYGIPINLQNPTFPSGGFIRSFSDAVNDISHGLLRHIKTQRNTIKAATKTADIVIAVGDIFCLWQARNKAQNTIFLPTAKSDTFMPHSKLETWLIKRFASLCFPRDEITTNSLGKMGVNAHYFGNPMMDNLLDTSPLENTIADNLPIIGILPGSREEAYANLQFIDVLLSKLPLEATAIAAISPSIDRSKLTPLQHCILSTQFHAIINHATVIIGLAGTANEQAAYLGKPVLCFPGFGPQSTAQRFQEQQLLMGENIHFVNSQNPDILIEKLSSLLTLPAKPLPTLNQNAAQEIVKKILSTVSLFKG